MRFRDLKLGTKQGIGFGLILVIMAGVSIFAITQMAALRDEIDDINTIWLQRAVVISRLNIDASTLRATQLQHAFATGDVQKQAYVAAMLALVDSVDAAWDTYAGLQEESAARNLFSESDEKLSADLDGLWDQYLEQSLAYLSLFDENRNREAIDLLNGAAGDVFADFSAALATLVQRNETRAAEAAQRAERTYRTTRNQIILLLAGTVLLSILFAARLVRFITIPVRQLVEAARKVAGGDFNVRPAIPSQDEIGQLARSFTRMTASLHTQQEALRTTNAELEEKSESLARQKAEIEQKNEELEQTLHKLRDTQQQLLMKEKMASLGQLTAGIAHEIKNPLNFVNNFASLSVELAEELGEELEANREKRVAEVLDEVQELLSDLRFNALKINEHGQRADSIVRGMLLHSRGKPGERQPVEVNALVEEYVNLAYHGMRARQPDFNVTIERSYDDAVGTLDLVPQEMGRVLLNLFDNAFYAVWERARSAGESYQPRLCVGTKAVDHTVEIRVQDNGGGIPEAIRARIFEPFFTTKPPGSGNTGLGLSLSYDIVTQGHGGSLEVASIDGQGTTFVIGLRA